MFKVKGLIWIIIFSNATLYFCYLVDCDLMYITQVHLGDTPHDLSESDFETLGYKTEGFSGSDISVCVSIEPNKVISFL